jgi:superfamily II DNA or RNA helicase
VEHVLITGRTPKPTKELLLQAVLDGRVRVLVGTASLATGTDGLDRVIDTLLIVDDTSDDSLRRQLVGRVLPRGTYVAKVAKKILRLVPA